MALFGKKKDAETTATAAVPAVVKAPQSQTPIAAGTVLVRPRITEKAALLIDKNVYTFEVTRGATKYHVRDAIKSLYNVTPIAIHIVNKQPRHFMSRARGRDMMEHGLRKAYVYLKKGDRIDLV
jgi:large subunit ribosomal protein L23